jgi:hypothetical protein
MPVLEFHNEESGKTISVLVKQSEPIESFHRQTVDGVVYKRVYAAPLAGKDMRPSADATQNDFDRMVSGKRGLTVGDAWDTAKDLSDKRAAKNGGIDPKKEEFYRDYQKKTGGKHMDVKKREAMEKAKKVMKDMGIKVE